MDLSVKMQGALNSQVANEFHSAYLYLSMSAWLDERNLPGMAKWLRKQSQEELGHGMKILGFITDRRGVVELAGISKPPASWDSPAAVFENAFNHEQGVTHAIHGLVELAEGEKDRATVSFLDWFVTEQVEEEASTAAAMERLKLADSHAGALLALDAEFGRRE